jgi:hypothetical protein
MTATVWSYHGVSILSFGMNRSDLQALAQTKADDALILFERGSFSNAYYLAGYSIELGLKACIARQILAETIPDKSFISNVYVHKFGELVRLAGLSEELKLQQDKDSTFQENWGTMSEWSPDIRYDVVDQPTCEFFLNAIMNEKHGVLRWIKSFW